MKFNFNEEILNKLYDSDSNSVILLGYDNNSQNMLARIVIGGSLEFDKPLRSIQVWLLSRDYNDFLNLPKQDELTSEISENVFVLKDCTQLYNGILDWVDIQVTDGNPMYAALLTETTIETNDIGYNDLVTYASKYVEDIKQQLKDNVLFKA